MTDFATVYVLSLFNVSPKAIWESILSVPQAAYAMVTLEAQGRLQNFSWKDYATISFSFTNAYAVAALNVLTFEQRAAALLTKPPVTIDQVKKLVDFSTPSQVDAYEELLHMVDLDYCGAEMLDRKAIPQLETLALCFKTMEQADALRLAIDHVRGYYTADIIEHICQHLTAQPLTNDDCTS